MRTLSALLACLLTGGLSSALAEPPSLAKNASCKECHQAAWAQWKSSRHAVAGTNSTFKFEYQSHPGNWCLGCHAPRKQVQEPALTHKRALRAGVDCLSCHMQEGQLVSASKADSSPHQTKVDGNFGSTDMCAGCHQFNFPVLSPKGELISYTDQPMQDTANEFRRSAMSSSGTECVSCHMPGGSHAFPGAYDAKQVRKALQLSVCQNQTALQVTISNRLQAHNLPSGGINRAIVLSLWAANNPGGVRKYRLERLFKGPLGKRVKRKDTTLGPGQSATWKVLRSYLSLDEVKTIHLQSQF